MLLAYWVHDLSPFLIRFTDTIGIRYYGLSYMLGFLTAGWLLRRYALAGRSPLRRHGQSRRIRRSWRGYLGIRANAKNSVFTLLRSHRFLCRSRAHVWPDSQFH